MHIDTGIIRVIQIDSQGHRAARIECPESLIPDPGRYIIANNPKERDSPLGHSLFISGLPDDVEATLPLLGPIPSTWIPGTRLTLHGPLGQGFQVHRNIHRVAIATFSGTLTRLLPILGSLLESGVDVAAFLPGQLSLTRLPTAIEVHLLHTLPESLTWPNLLVLEIPLAGLSNLREWLKLGPHDRLPCPTQALILTPMPCGTLADCGACAVPSKKMNCKLACKDGPVFDLNQLEW